MPTIALMPPPAGDHGGDAANARDTGHSDLAAKLEIAKHSLDVTQTEAGGLFLKYLA